MRKGKGYGGGMSPGVRQRRVRGRKHMRRVDLYFSPEEKQVVELAAERSGLSVSFYGAQALLRQAMADIGPKSPADFLSPKNS